MIFEYTFLAVCWLLIGSSLTDTLVDIEEGEWGFWLFFTIFWPITILAFLVGWVEGAISRMRKRL